MLTDTRVSYTLLLIVVWFRLSVQFCVKCFVKCDMKCILYVQWACMRKILRNVRGYLSFSRLISLYLELFHFVLIHRISQVFLVWFYLLLNWCICIENGFGLPPSSGSSVVAIIVFVTVCPRDKASLAASKFHMEIWEIRFNDSFEGPGVKMYFRFVIGCSLFADSPFSVWLCLKTSFYNLWTYLKQQPCRLRWSRQWSWWPSSHRCRHPRFWLDSRWDSSSQCVGCPERF